MKTNIHFLSYLAHFFIDWEMFQTKIVDKIKTHILCSVTFFFFENRAVYETMLKNIVKAGRPQKTIWCMRFARLIPETTNTLSEYVTHCFSTATIVARTHLSVTSYVH